MGTSGRQAPPDPQRPLALQPECPRAPPALSPCPSWEGVASGHMGQEGGAWHSCGGLTPSPCGPKPFLARLPHGVTWEPQLPQGHLDMPASPSVQSREPALHLRMSLHVDHCWPKGPQEPRPSGRLQGSRGQAFWKKENPDQLVPVTKARCHSRSVSWFQVEPKPLWPSSQSLKWLHGRAQHASHGLF